MDRDFWNMDFWKVTKGYIDVSSMDMVSNGEYIGTTEEYYDEGLGGFVSFKIYESDGTKYICSREGWVFRNP